MKEKLEELLKNFGTKLTEAEYNQYIPKLRDYFVPYILENKGDVNEIEALFKYELTRNDIIKSTEFYIIKNENVESKGAIDDFLISLNQLFELEINDKYFNQNLINIRPFMKLNSEIEGRLIKVGIKLKDKEAVPAINQNQYEEFIDFMKKDNGEKITPLQCRIIIKMLLLYGFSPERIFALNISDFVIEKRVLRVTYCENPYRFINLELPYSLFNDLVKHFELRKNIQGNNKLFVRTTGKEIAHSYLDDYFKNVKQSYYEKNHSERVEEINSFTFTGLAKYAIINMILNGMNQSIIMDLTGFKSDVFEYCQEQVNNIKAISKDRYVNSKIRNIKTFDLI